MPASSTQKLRANLGPHTTANRAAVASGSARPYAKASSHRPIRLDANGDWKLLLLGMVWRGVDMWVCESHLPYRRGQFQIQFAGSGK